MTSPSFSSFLFGTLAILCTLLVLIPHRINASGTGAWIWASGNQTTSSGAVYVSVNGSVVGPGPRYDTVTWVDASGNFYLFGGTASPGKEICDFWKYSPSSTTWSIISYSTTQPPAGSVVGSRGMPPGRFSANSWTDSNGNLWLFGGASAGTMNDLWMYDFKQPGNWTFIGPSAADLNEGTVPQGSTGWPNNRQYAASWTDNAGNFWIFGGIRGQSIDDIWMFSPSTMVWTFYGGSPQELGTGVYPTAAPKNQTSTPNATNYLPSARDSAMTWTATNGILWMFGGEYVYGITLADLWAFNPCSKNWTLIENSTTYNQFQTYENVPAVVPAASGQPGFPGARISSAVWSGNDGKLWMFGGFPPNTVSGDFWELNTTNSQWTYLGGQYGSSTGTYVAHGQAGYPSSRGGAATWKGLDGSLWLFGGTANSDDMWYYTGAISTASSRSVPACSVPTVPPTTLAPTSVLVTTAAPTTPSITTTAPITTAPSTTSPTTASPTTAAPSTPSTAAPLTVAPSTAAPSTAAPSTAAPSTVAPSTVVPSTAAPSTVAPSTAAPSTAAPLTAAPSTVVPSTAAPLTAAPSTVAPSTAAPSTVAPSTLAPSTATPSTAAPSTPAHSVSTASPIVSISGVIGIAVMFFINF